MKKIILIISLLVIFMAIPIKAISNPTLVIEFPRDVAVASMVNEGDDNTLITIYTRSGRCLQYKMNNSAKFIAFRQCGEEDWITNIQIY